MSPLWASLALASALSSPKPSTGQLPVRRKARPAELDNDYRLRSCVGPDLCFSMTTPPVDIPPIFDPTTTYWQSIVKTGELTISPHPPYNRGFPAPLPDGRFLVLPLRAI